MKWCSVSQIWSKPSSSVHSICSSSRWTTSSWLSPGAAWKKKKVPKRIERRSYTGSALLSVLKGSGPPALAPGPGATIPELARGPETRLGRTPRAQRQAPQRYHLLGRDDEGPESSQCVECPLKAGGTRETCYTSRRENHQRPRPASAMARGRGTFADREGDRYHSRCPSRGQARALGRAPQATQAVRSRRPREVAAADRGWPGVTLGRSCPPGGASGSALSPHRSDLPRHELPAEAPTRGARQRGGAIDGGPRVRGHRLRAHGGGGRGPASGRLARRTVPTRAISRLRRPVERVLRDRPIPVSSPGRRAVSDSPAPGS